MGALGWIAAAALGLVSAAPGHILSDRTLPAVLMPLPGLLLGAGVIALMRPSPPRPGGFSLGFGAAAVLLAATLVVLALTIAGEESHDLKPLNAALIAVFGPLTLFVAAFAVEAIRRGDGIAIESHWGGLGGGLGGWRLSTGGVLLFATLLMAGATCAGALFDPAMLKGAHDAKTPAADGNASSPSK